MDRRTFLKFGTAGATGIALPGWLARAFFQQLESPDRREQARRLLEEVWGRARDRGKPLLALVIPRDPAASRERGTLLGGALNAASDETLADHALCEVVCLPVETLRARFPEAKLAREPLAVFLESLRGGTHATAADPELPPSLSWGFGETPSRAEVEASAAERAEKAAAAIGALVAADGEALDRRAEAARSTLSPKEVEALEAMSAGRAPIDLDLADRGAALLARLADADPGRRIRGRQALRDAAARRLLETAPPGAGWARDDGCGAVREDGEAGMQIACGMGYVPKASRRFLWFFTEEG